MSNIAVSLKWGKVSYSNQLILHPGSSARGLKLQVESLTAVPVDRQKLLCPKVWKGALKDGDEIPGDIAVPEGKKKIVVTLIGSSESLAEKPLGERPRFSEDMTPREMWEATRSRAPEGEGDATIVDIVALQKEAGMDRDDGKMEMYQYNRMVTGLPQNQINDMLVTMKEQKLADNGDESKPTSSAPLLGEVVMTLGMELRRAYINSMALLPSGTVVSGSDDGHVHLWRRGQLMKDARHPSTEVDLVLASPSPTGNGPSFVTTGDGSICLWTEEGDRLMHFASYPGTTPASIAAGSVGEANSAKYLASCFRVTRQPDPNQFRLLPQNEAERRRREAAEIREELIQNELLRVSKSVKLWIYGGSQDRADAVMERVITLDELEDTAPITKLLDMNGRLAFGDGWGCLRIFECAQSLESNNNPSLQWRQRSVMQFRGSGIACMAQLEAYSLAVSIQPENTGIVPSAVPLRVASNRCICILDTNKARIKAILNAHSDTVHCICPLPDGGILSAGGKMDATVRVWDSLLLTKDSDADDEATIITEAKTLKQPGYVFDLMVLPDSNGSNAYAIAAARYNVIKIVL